MPRTRREIALGLLLAAPALFAQAPVAQTSPAAAPVTPPATTAAVIPHGKSHKNQKPLVLPPLPSGPLSQMPMDQLPATPAKVSYQNGLLTISAQNSTLGEILRDVRKLTGATIDIPPGSGANERVVTQLGPGAPRDVLAGLLNGSSFNYVMLGSDSDPTAVASVMLTAKPSSTGDTQTANLAANGYETNPGPIRPNGPPAPMPFRSGIFPQAGQPGIPQPAGADSDDKDEDQDSADDSEDQAQPGQPDANGANGNANPQQQPQPDANQQPNAGPSPEKILDLLRRQQPPGSAPPQPPQPPQ